MNCQECQDLLHPYLDGEMDAAQRSDVDAHLKSCADCRKELEQLQALSRALRLPEFHYTASDTLKQRLQAKLREADARERRPAWGRWAAAAAVVIAAAGVGWYLTPDAEDRMADAAIAQHAQAVDHNRLYDFPSNSPSVLQLWLSNQLPYTPPVQDFAKQGYALVGARVTSVDDQPAAALIYRHGEDFVSVFVCQADKPGDTPLDADDDSGYNVVYWTQGSLSFWVVSKIAPAELKRFSRTLHQAI